MVDRQEEIRGQIVGGGDAFDEAAPGLPSVRSNLVLAKPSAFNFSSICFARRRLKANSETLRALIAPSDSAVCPTSRTIRNFEGSHRVATGFKAAGLK
jgi:hypothetical protein